MATKATTRMMPRRQRRSELVGIIIASALVDTLVQATNGTVSAVASTVANTVGVPNATGVATSVITSGLGAAAAGAVNGTAVATAAAGATAAAVAGGLANLKIIDPNEAVTLVLTITNVNFRNLSTNVTLLDNFEKAVRTAIANEAKNNVTFEDVSTALSGVVSRRLLETYVQADQADERRLLGTSVMADSKVDCPAGVMAASIKNTLASSTTLADSVVRQVSAVPGIFDSAATQPIDATVTSPPQVIGPQQNTSMWIMCLIAAVGLLALLASLALCCLCCSGSKKTKKNTTRKDDTLRKSTTDRGDYQAIPTQDPSVEANRTTAPVPTTALPTPMYTPQQTSYQYPAQTSYQYPAHGHHYAGQHMAQPFHQPTYVRRY